MLSHTVLAAAGPSALPLLIELGGAAAVALLLALRGPVRRAVGAARRRARPAPARRIRRA